MFTINSPSLVQPYGTIIDSLGTFRIAMHFVGRKYPLKVIAVLLLSLLPFRSCLELGVVATSRDACDCAQFLDG